MNILVALLLLSFLILIHELGHYISARIFKVTIKEFSIFMGPKLFQKTYKGIKYSIRLIPMGGYVAMEGETETSDDQNALLNKPKWQQAIIMFSGAFVNIVFGLIAFIVLTTTSGYVTNQVDGVNEKVPDMNNYIYDSSLKYDTTSPAELAGLQDGDTLLTYNGHKITYPVDVYLFAVESKGDSVRITYERDGIVFESILDPITIPPISTYKIGVYFGAIGEDETTVIEVIEDSPAMKGGLKNGDVLVSVNDEKIETRDDITSLITKNKDVVGQFVVLRDGKEVTLNIRPEESVSEETFYNGLYFIPGEGGFIASLGASFRYFASVIKSVYYSIGWLISGKVKLGEAMGPIGIVSTLGNVVSQKASISSIVKQLLSMLGLISINLGFVNLLPFPALDGSKLVILLVEKVTNKKIPMEKQAFISMIGFILLITLLIVITSKDIMRLFGR